MGLWLRLSDTPMLPNLMYLPSLGSLLKCTFLVTIPRDSDSRFWVKLVSENCIQIVQKAFNSPSAMFLKLSSTFTCPVSRSWFRSRTTETTSNVALVTHQPHSAQARSVKPPYNYSTRLLPISCRKWFMLQIHYTEFQHCLFWLIILPHCLLHTAVIPGYHSSPNTIGTLLASIL